MFVFAHPFSPLLRRFVRKNHGNIARSSLGEKIAAWSFSFALHFRSRLFFVSHLHRGAERGETFLSPPLNNPKRERRKPPRLTFWADCPSAQRAAQNDIAAPPTHRLSSPFAPFLGLKWAVVGSFRCTVVFAEWDFLFSLSLESRPSRKWGELKADMSVATSA